MGNLSDRRRLLLVAAILGIPILIILGLTVITLIVQIEMTKNQSPPNEQGTKTFANADFEFSYPGYLEENESKLVLANLENVDSLEKSRFVVALEDAGSPSYRTYYVLVRDLDVNSDYSDRWDWLIGFAGRKPEEEEKNFPFYG